MTAVPFTLTSLRNVKLALKPDYQFLKSSHLTEALAAGCGYRSHAALLEDLKRSPIDDPDYVLLDDEAFVDRAWALAGEPVPSQEEYLCFEFLEYPDPSKVLSTQGSEFWDLKYSTTRARAWRNMMVCAINAGIIARHFTVVAGDNRWPASHPDDPSKSKSFVYDFRVGDIPALAYVHDIGYAELGIHVAFWPTAQGRQYIGAYGTGFDAADAYASGWLERQDGAWLQYAPEFLHCRRSRLAIVERMRVRPKGYADRGKVK